MKRSVTPPPVPPNPQLPASCEPPSPSRPTSSLVWLIYGATGHLGRSISRVALARGDRVSAVGRNIPTEEASMHGWHKRCQGLVCDVRERSTVDHVFARAREYWGEIDIVVKSVPPSPSISL
jgi:NAD(P)-dependent dehydrogenase (short-subunit alcohol dehydrogenase family)